MELSMQKPAHIQFIIREKSFFCDRNYGCCMTVYLAIHNMAYTDKGQFLIGQIIIVTKLLSNLLHTL